MPGPGETSADWDQVAAWRTRRQGLGARRPASELVEVASRLCGLHAQLKASAELTAWARLDDLPPGAVTAALWDERTLVKTWAMRGTLHLLPASEIGLWWAVLGTDDRHTKASWQKAFGATPEELDELVAAIARALHGRELTRAELADEVERETGSAHFGEGLRGSWGPLLKPAAWRGGLCFAPGEGSKVRFTNPATWLPATGEEWEPEEALREAARRYLATHGPATREDFARWLAKRPAPGGRIIESLGDDVAQVRIEGEPHWALAADAADLAAAEPVETVRLLPAFDQYVIAGTLHAERLMPGPHKPRVYRDQGWISAVLLVNGRMDGIWKHERKGKRLTVSIEPLTKLTKATKAAAEHEADLLAAYLGGDLTLTWT